MITCSDSRIDGTVIKVSLRTIILYVDNRGDMVSDVTVIGIRGGASFDDIVGHFTSLGGEVILMDPLQVYGSPMLISAVAHAERAFERNENSSRNILTEIILYASGERQISKALSKMGPKEGCEEYVALLLDVEGDLKLDSIGMERDDSIVDGNDSKAEAMGLTNGLSIPYDDLALERVAMVDILKKSK